MEYSTKTLVDFFKREIKKTEPMTKDDLEPLLFAIAYQARREDFESAAKYVLKRF
jgi:hypothetical protein